MVNHHLLPTSIHHNHHHHHHPYPFSLPQYFFTASYRDRFHPCSSSHLSGLKNKGFWDLGMVSWNKQEWKILSFSLFVNSSRVMESKALPLRFMTHQSIFSMVGSGDLDGLKQLVEKLNKEEDDNNNNNKTNMNGSSSPSVSDVMSLQNDNGETALYIAAEHNLRELFTFLLRLCSFEVLKIRSKSDMNAFHVAAKRGHLGRSFLSFLPGWVGLGWLIQLLFYGAAEWILLLMHEDELAYWDLGASN